MLPHAFTHFLVHLPLVQRDNASSAGDRCRKTSTPGCTPSTYAHLAPCSHL